MVTKCSQTWLYEDLLIRTACRFIFLGRGGLGMRPGGRRGGPQLGGPAVFLDALRAATNRPRAGSSSTTPSSTMRPRAGVCFRAREEPESVPRARRATIRLAEGSDQRRACDQAPGTRYSLSKPFAFSSSETLSSWVMSLTVRWSWTSPELDIATLMP